MFKIIKIHKLLKALELETIEIYYPNTTSLIFKWLYKILYPYFLVKRWTENIKKVVISTLIIIDQ